MWWYPAATAAAVRPVPRPTLTGLLLVLVVPSPSWPFELPPQHTREASSSMAHAWSKPAVIVTAMRPVPMPIVLPLLPPLFWPQHLTEPSSSMAQEL